MLGIIGTLRVYAAKYSMFGTVSGITEENAISIARQFLAIGKDIGTHRVTICFGTAVCVVTPETAIVEPVGEFTCYTSLTTGLPLPCLHGVNPFSYCDVCGGVQFSPDGAQLAERALECDLCAALNDLDGTFCTVCGTDFGGAQYVNTSAPVEWNAEDILRNAG